MADENHNVVESYNLSLQFLNDRDYYLALNQYSAALAQAQRSMNIALTALHSKSPAISKACCPSPTSSQGLFSSLFTRASVPPPTQIQNDGVIVSFSNSAGSTKVFVS